MIQTCLVVFFSIPVCLAVLCLLTNCLIICVYNVLKKNSKRCTRTKKKEEENLARKKLSFVFPQFASARQISLHSEKQKNETKEKKVDPMYALTYTLCTAEHPELKGSISSRRSNASYSIASSRHRRMRAFCWAGLRGNCGHKEALA